MSGIFKDYWKETQRPVYSAMLIFPFLCIYHVGTIFLDIKYINGADALIMRILDLFSVHSSFGSAMVLIVYFAVWQWRTHAGWKFNRKILLMSYMESLCLAVVLLWFFGQLSPRLNLVMEANEGGISNLVLYCGAGIYEELVFRAFLLGLLVLLFRKGLRMQPNTAAISAAISGAILFSVFHYIGPAGDIFSIGSFVQRMLGGLYFSIVFVTRGFGITAACHAFYDILVGLILS